MRGDSQAHKHSVIGALIKEHQEKSELPMREREIMVLGSTVYAGMSCFLSVSRRMLTARFSCDGHGKVCSPARNPALIRLQTKTVIHSFIFAMVLHPGAYAKAQAEMDRVVGPNRLPTLEDRDSLPYLECVLREVYRCVVPSRTPGMPVYLLASRIV